jgi:Zn-dependent peptidase ImmA (M78 family)
MNAVNHKVIQWARERNLLSIEDVATQLSMSPEIVIKWESGESEPEYKILEKLAYGILKIPLAGFFVKSIPKDVDPEVKFRTLIRDVSNEKYLIGIIRHAACMQSYLEEIYDNESKWVERKKSIKNGTNIYDFVTSIKSALNIENNYKMNVKSPEKYFDYLRNQLFDSGIYVFKEAFKNEDISGFCLPDQMFPVIMVNNSVTVTRQIFTLIHELSHIVIENTGVTNWRNGYLESLDESIKDEEIFCNKVAAEFLVPKEILEWYISQYSIGSEKLFEDLAHVLSVSREVVARICLDNGIIEDNRYSLLRQKWNAQIIRSLRPGGNYYYTKRAYLGKKYAQDVFAGYYSKKWNKLTASEYLTIKSSNFENFERIMLEK